MYQVIVFLPDFNFNERTYSEAAVIDTEFLQFSFQKLTRLYQYLKLDTPLYYAHALIHVQVLLMTVGST